MALKCFHELLQPLRRSRKPEGAGRRYPAPPRLRTLRRRCTTPIRKWWSARFPEWEDKILLCRRAIEPRAGLWTLPAGFMENAETTAEAAARETLEEACARVEIGPIFSFINVPHINQVHILYRARLLDLDFAPGDESLEVELFDEAAIPWKEIAFRTIGMTLRHYLRGPENRPVRLSRQRPAASARNRATELPRYRTPPASARQTRVRAANRAGP